MSGLPDDRLAGRVAALETELAVTRRTHDELANRLEQLEAAGPTQAPVGRPGERFAAIYPAFQDRFRGSEAEISRRLCAYLPDVERLVGSAGSGGVADIGPGRGEWLALLQERGVPAYGIDTNPACVEVCRAKGLPVVHAPAAQHLRALPGGSLDMVTAFHVIEHVAIDDLLELIDAARHALRPGGCLLVETPNPTNLVMGACDFYNDPTHRSPLPPALTEYLVAAAGFEAVEVRQLHPRDEQFGKLAADAGEGPLRLLAETVAKRMFGPLDYAVLGYRPTR